MATVVVRKKKRPSQASGLAAGPSRNQRRPSAKTPYDRAKKVLNALNPFG